MNKKLSRSPARFSFQRESYIKRKLEEGRDMNDPDILSELDFMNTETKMRLDRENKPEFSKNNMEYDLRSNDWILNKVRTNEVYAQNLYAALCNNDFQKTILEDTADNIVSVLKDGLPTWSCSWRYAGGIIADMREDGDYIDWYCSGIRGGMDLNEDEYTDEQRERLKVINNFVPESVITDEIRSDLLKLGWKVLEDTDVD